MIHIGPARPDEGGINITRNDITNLSKWGTSSYKQFTSLNTLISSAGNLKMVKYTYKPTSDVNSIAIQASSYSSSFSRFLCWIGIASDGYTVSGYFQDPSASSTNIWTHQNSTWRANLNVHVWCLVSY